MKVTGSIVTYNNEETIERCIGSVLQQAKAASGADYDFQLYVYDNGSTDNTLKIIQKKFPSVRLIRDSYNRGFGAGHNALIKLARSDYHFVINPDIYIDMDTIGTLTEYLEKHPEVGLVTPKILNTDGTEQYLPKYCPSVRHVIISKFPGFHYLRREYTRQDEGLNSPTEIAFCTGCFFGARTSYLKKMKGFSNRYFMYCEDADLSMRVLKDNKKIIFYPYVTAYHNWQRDNTGNIKGIFRFLRSLMVFFKKWGFRF